MTQESSDELNFKLEQDVFHFNKANYVISKSLHFS